MCYVTKALCSDHFKLFPAHFHIYNNLFKQQYCTLNKFKQSALTKYRFLFFKNSN